MIEPLPAFPGARFEQFRQLMAQEGIRHVTAVSLQTREHSFGVIFFPHAARSIFGSSNLRLLIGLDVQVRAQLRSLLTDALLWAVLVVLAMASAGALVVRSLFRRALANVSATATRS